MLGELVGGLLGQGHAQAGYDAQKAAINQMIAKLDSVGMPPDQSAAVILDQYKQAGILNPQLEQQVKDSVSAYSQIKADASTRDTQVQALKQMSQFGKAGFTSDERAQNRLAQGDVQRQNEANQQSIIQNAQMRGQAGGGAELAARLLGTQGSANNASEQADRMSSMAAQRALQAIGQSASMAGQLNQQDFNQAAQKASASDEMNRFNVQNQMAINQQNTGIANQAQASNLSNLQSLNNANVGQNNQEKYNQLQRQRQYWQDKLNYAQAYANPLQQSGQVGLNQEMSKAKMDAGLGKSFDDTAWNVVGMMYGKAPSQTASTGVGENQGQGPTQANNKGSGLINGY